MEEEELEGTTLEDEERSEETALDEDELDDTELDVNEDGSTLELEAKLLEVDVTALEEIGAKSLEEEAAAVDEELEAKLLYDEAATLDELDAELLREDPIKLEELAKMLVEVAFTLEELIEPETLLLLGEAEDRTTEEDAVEPADNVTLRLVASATMLDDALLLSDEAEEEILEDDAVGPTVSVELLLVTEESTLEDEDTEAATELDTPLLLGEPEDGRLRMLLDDEKTNEEPLGPAETVEFALTDWAGKLDDEDAETATELLLEEDDEALEESLEDEMPEEGAVGPAEVVVLLLVTCVGMLLEATTELETRLLLREAEDEILATLLDNGPAERDAVGPAESVALLLVDCVGTLANEDTVAAAEVDRALLDARPLVEETTLVLDELELDAPLATRRAVHTLAFLTRLPTVLLR
ncbi:hypothetical protein LTS18_013007 [Coniosporium uncinatum]|uniref:Uncharacterized protein n=1 Tax=Coniosporium uncinatum TaxID=93489 RepID=A0ACC3DIF6_9PEZI|nr:hypothetical protein LTS18_013007 [Coniosporium uncinatum]